MTSIVQQPGRLDLRRRVLRYLGASTMKHIAVLTLIGCALAAWLGGLFTPLPPGARRE